MCQQGTARTELAPHPHCAVILHYTRCMLAHTALRVSECSDSSGSCVCWCWLGCCCCCYCCCCCCYYCYWLLLLLLLLCQGCACANEQGPG